jgi:hypothetical protein
MIKKFREKVSNSFNENDPFTDEGCFFPVLSFLITPAIFYIIGYLLFGSHRLSLFILAPSGLLMNFLFIKIVIIQRYIIGILFIWGILIYIVYLIFKFLSQIWYALPN